MATCKRYPHITGIHGDGGENEGALAVTALLDPGPNLPECARIIVGSPRRTPTIDGYIPDLGGFLCGPDAAERLIATLQDAVRDVRAAIGQVPAPSGPLAHATRLEADKAECDRINLESMAHIQGLEMQLRFLRLECGNRKAALAVACELIGSLQVERASNAQAFASPADRIANLEHELADLRESETTQATRIERLIAEHHAATTEVAELRERMESWVRASGAAR